MKKIFLATALLFSLTTLSARELMDKSTKQEAQMDRLNNEDVIIEAPQFIFSHTNNSVAVKFKNPSHPKLLTNNYKLHFIVNGTDQLVEFGHDGVGTINASFKANNRLSVLFENVNYAKELPVISIWYMLLPLAGLLLFIGYKIVFSKINMSISNKEMADIKLSTAEKKGFKIIDINSAREEEVLVSEM